MSNWWEIQQACGGDPQPGVRAVAYYRHSAQDRQVYRVEQDRGIHPKTQA
jgi:hypothetical protein